MQTSGSYWQQEAGYEDRWTGLPIPGSADCVVIGGGSAGLCAATEVQRMQPSARVLLLESQRIAYGASGRNAGFLSPLPAPIWVLGSGHSSEDAWAAATIHGRVQDVARMLAAEIPEAELRPATLSILGGSRLYDQGLIEFSRLLKSAGLDHHLVPSRARPGRLSLQMPAHTVHPYRLALGMARRAIDAGVMVCEGARVRRIESLQEGALVHLDEGVSVHAGRVIICTNADTSDLSLGERMAALGVHSFMMASSPLVQTDRAQSVDGDFTVELGGIDAYHRLHHDRLVYGGMDKVWMPAGADFDVPESMSERLAAKLRQEAPGAQVSASWAGRYHETLSGLPIIERSAKHPAMVLNVGYGSTGLTLSLTLSRLAAALACDASLNTDETRLLGLIKPSRVPVVAALIFGARVARGLLRRVEESAPSRRADEELDGACDGPPGGG